jgi:DNA-binding PadR family transcriptional regulator
MKMRKSSFTTRLMKLFAQARVGLTMPEIWKKVEGDYCSGARQLHVYLSQIRRKGWLRCDGRRECSGCGRAHVVYRITDKGRMILAEVA